MSKKKSTTKPKAAKAVKPAKVKAAPTVLQQGLNAAFGVGKSTAKVKAEAPAKTERVAKNGVPQPGDGTACRAIWDLCDKLGKDITFEALRAGIDSKVADATIRTQRQRHKQFNA